MKYINVIIFLSAILLAESILIYDSNRVTLAQEETIAIPDIHPKIIDILPLPTEPPYPKPSYTPTLRKYEINKNDDIWHAQDPSSYITPNNEWVQYYAKKSLLNISITLNYKKDSDMYPDDINKDMWQNVDYTAYMEQGDCEDLSMLWVSMHIANGNKAIVVGGYLEDEQGKRIRDFWYEYISEYGHFTKVVSGSAITANYKLIPKYMFNDKITWRNYNANWYNN